MGWSRGQRLRVPRLLLCLMLAGRAAQVIPFFIYHVPDAETVATVVVPADYPADYGASDLARARAFNRGLLFGGMARSVTWVLTVLTLLASGIAARIGLYHPHTRRAWLIRVLFLVAVFICLRVVEIPFILCRLRHFQAFGLTPLTFGGWTELLLLGLPLPLTLFVLKYLLVICSFPLFRQFWWIGSCLCIFLLFEVVPEAASRRYPVDPVTTLSPLPQGPHSDAITAVLRTTGTSLPLMVVDQGSRENTANIYIAGRHGREYVVITDTFLRQFPPEDAALALAHELAHLGNATALRLTDKALSLLALTLGFFLAFLLTGRTAVPISAALNTVLVLMLCMTLASFLLQPFSRAYTRSQELAADREAVRLVPERDAYQRLLVKMAKLNLDPLEMPGWEEYFFSSYPSAMTRLRSIERGSPDASHTERAPQPGE